MQEKEKVLQDPDQDSGSNSNEYCRNSAHAGQSSKTSPAYSVAIKDVTSQQSFKGWKNAGSMEFPGQYWTGDTSMSRNVAEDCSLWQVLQDKDRKSTRLNSSH